MMGLTNRLHLARTLMWTGLRSTPSELADVVASLDAARAGLVVLVQPDAQPGDLAIGYRAGQRRLGTHTILGVASDADTAMAVRADLFVQAATGPAARGHEWSLALRVVNDPAQLRAALADDAVDGIVVAPDVVDEAMRAAPPANPASKPWFAQLGEGRQASQLVDAGVRRIAMEAGPSDQVGGQFRDLDERLAHSWQTEMQAVTMAAMRRR